MDAYLRNSRRILAPYNDPESLKVKSIASGVECATILFCFGAVFLSLEHFEMPYIMMLLAVQLNAITQAVAAKLAPQPAASAPPAMPVAFRPGIVAS